MRGLTVLDVEVPSQGLDLLWPQDVISKADFLLHPSKEKGSDQKPQL